MSSLFLILTLSLSARTADPPNVLIVITDDQGYGDLACHGNPHLKTPSLDALHQRSVRLTDFHVDPTCSPTRSALMTGRYSTRTGVWHTIAGRSLMRPQERTLGEIFADAGYATAAFGKWHLGDTRGLRSYEQGFPLALNHGGGGVTQTPDFWGNDYFDDVYFGSPAYNGTPLPPDGRAEQFDGYCTDVWFDQAWRFINDAAAGGRPWLCYLATNAPHSPFIPPEGDRDEQLVAAGLPPTMANFYAMVENIDTNMGRLLARLDAADLTRDTLVLYLTDNGTAAGANQKGGHDWKTVAGFNAGMRAKKGSYYEGGHRVPCFWHWPGGDIGGESAGRDVDTLTAHIDVLPTLVDLCGVDAGDHPAWDGTSLAGALRGDAEPPSGRTLFVHSQRIQTPQKGRNFAVMTDQYRYCSGGELYDIEADPGQRTDIAAEKPLVVRELQAAYDRWWESLSPSFETTVRLSVEPRAGVATRLTAHDWHPTGEDRWSEMVPWSQAAVRQDPVCTGWFALRVEEAGRYRVRGRMRPAGQLHALTAGTASFTCGDVTAEADVPADDLFGEVTVELPVGDHRLEFTHTPPGGDPTGYYFVELVRVDDAGGQPSE